MPAHVSTPVRNGRTAARAYPVSLQQAAAAIFGVAIIDGAPARRPTDNSFREKQ